MHLNAKLVTLSACDTGVGPVGEAGVANLVNAFVEAGADSVVSTLWELEDHSTEHLMTLFYSKLALHERKVKHSGQLNSIYSMKGFRRIFGQASKLSATLPEPFKHTRTLDDTYPLATRKHPEQNQSPGFR